MIEEYLRIACVKLNQRVPMEKSVGTLRIKLILLRNVKLRAITKLENSTSETQFCLIYTFKDERASKKSFVRLIRFIFKAFHES